MHKIGEEPPVVSSDASDPGDRFTQLIGVFVVIPIIFVATYFISQIPSTVLSYRSLGDFANGKSVEFRADYKGEFGRFAHVELERYPVLLEVKPSANEVSPKVDTRYRVVGKMKHTNGQLVVNKKIVQYVIENAELHPASSR